MSDADDPSGELGRSIGHVHFAKCEARSFEITAADHDALDDVIVFGNGTDYLSGNFRGLVGGYWNLSRLSVRCADQFLQFGGRHFNARWQEVEQARLVVIRFVEGNVSVLRIQVECSGQEQEPEDEDLIVFHN